MLRAYQQGVNKASGVTVFPHAIAQGASWDVDLVRRVSNATAIEARILSEQAYVKTHGASAGGVLSCDGGPLANSAHDPRWGRISETYGEDPLHIQTIGVAAMKGLQNPQPVPGGKPEDVFFATRQVTRHYIGYHGASPDIQGTRGGPPITFVATNRSLADCKIVILSRSFVLPVSLIPKVSLFQPRPTSRARGAGRRSPSSPPTAASPTVK